jgi:hypothetical protein
VLRGRILAALFTLAAMPGPIDVRAQSDLPPNPFHVEASVDDARGAVPPDPAADYFRDGSQWPAPDSIQPADGDAAPLDSAVLENGPFDDGGSDPSVEAFNRLGPPHDDAGFLGVPHDHFDAGAFDDRGPPPPSYRPIIDSLHLRHSFTHGRHVGLGRPLVGSSWLNRPYYVGGDLGNLWMTRGVAEAVGRDVDAFGGLFVGADWDYYWGNELAFHWSTPELRNGRAPTADHADSLFLWSYSLMYYPWGDSMIRPYWRWGIGNTRLDFPLDDGTRHGEWLLTFPIGMGVKYPVRRWLAARAELTDQLACHSNGIPTLNNITLTVGLEWRFGARPRSYWPWHPSRHIW